MLLRNYDNYMARMLLNTTEIDTFEDGHYGILDLNGYSTGVTLENSTRAPFQVFSKLENEKITTTTVNESYLKWSDSTEVVTYDEHNVSLPSTSTAVSISTSVAYDTDKKVWVKTVEAIYMAKEDLTVGSIVVCCSPCYYSPSKLCMVYRKVLDTPIGVSANANFILTFKTTISSNPNKPDDYEASATVIE